MDGVDEQDVGPHRKVLHRLVHGRFAGAEDVDAVDGLRLHHADGDGAGARDDQAAEGDAMLVIELLGVVDAEVGRLGIEDHTGGDDRAGEAAAADFIGSGDGPKTRIAEPALDHRHLGNARQLREQ